MTTHAHGHAAHDHDGDHEKAKPAKATKPTLTVSLVKKALATPNAKAGGKASGTAFGISDNQNNTITVLGIDAAGAQVDISDVATLTATVDNASVCSIDVPTGMTVAFSGLAPGVANFTLTATWNDPAAGIGPFTITLPVTCTGSAAVGIVATFGEPTIRTP